MEKDDSIHDLTFEWGGDIYPLLSWCKLEKLKYANVMVVGCGALGNEVLKNLALFGIGHLVIVDFDTIESSNLTRSILFTQADAQEEKSKAITAAQRIKQINPNIKTLPLQEDITHGVGLGLLKRMDVIIGCLDNRWARYCLNRLCMRVNKPWVDGGIDGLEGTARVFIPGKNCYACNLGPEALKDLSHRVSCSSVIRRNEEVQRVATTPVIASIIGAVEAQEAIKLLHREELAEGKLTSLCGKMFYYEGQHLTSKLVDFSGYDEECPSHEQWDPIIKSDLHRALPIKEVLEKLSGLLDSKDIEITLREHRFVDYILHRKTEKKYLTMLPDYDIPSFIEKDMELRFIPYNLFYQHEFTTINANFPYQELTLKEIGIPAWSILSINTEKGTFYVECMDELKYADCLS